MYMLNATITLLCAVGMCGLSSVPHPALPDAMGHPAGQVVSQDSGFDDGDKATGTVIDPPDQPATIRFTAYDVFVDTGDEQLAAYQIALESTSNNVLFAGVEGGEHEAFADAPYYDPAAMMHEKLIIAAFNTGDELPAGKARVARIHVQITGEKEPDFATACTVAAAIDGTPIEATITLEGGVN